MSRLSESDRQPRSYEGSHTCNYIINQLLGISCLTCRSSLASRSSRCSQRWAALLPAARAAGAPGTAGGSCYPPAGPDLHTWLQFPCGEVLVGLPWGSSSSSVAIEDSLSWLRARPRAHALCIRACTPRATSPIGIRDGVFSGSLFLKLNVLMDSVGPVSIIQE